METPVTIKAYINHCQHLAVETLRGVQIDYKNSTFLKELLNYNLHSKMLGKVSRFTDKLGEMAEAF